MCVVMEDIFEILLVKKSISKEKLTEIALASGYDLIKAVVDIKLKVMAIGGEMHSDEEKFLLEGGSSQGDLWGINLYLKEDKENWIEFDSMINIRPRQNNRSRYVENLEIRSKIIEIVNLLVE